MKITKINIDDFGCLAGKSFELSPTFNLVMGDNESGKSTLLAFIKFIFYGLPKKTQGTGAERDRHFSWQNNTAAGSISFTTDSGDSYTVERRITRRLGDKRESLSESLRIIDEKTGLEVHKGEIPGELFFGIPSAVFESTCFIRQSGVSNINTGELGSALENILHSADESLDLSRALGRLDDARKLLLYKNGKGGYLYELECEVNDLSARLAAAKTDYAKILAKTDEVSSRRKDLSNKKHELDELEDLFLSISKVAVVKRFDALHETEKELEEIMKKAADFHAANASADGFFPDNEYSSAISASLSSCITAKEGLDIAVRLLDEAGTEKLREQNAAATECPLSADEIRALGGADKICDEVEALLDLSDKKKKSSKALTVLFAILLVAGGALAALAFILPLFPLLYGGIGAVALAALFAALGAASSSASGKARKKAVARLSELGSTDSSGLSIKERITLLHSLLLSALERESILHEAEKKFDRASSTVELRRADLETAEKNAVALMEKWKMPEGDVQTALVRAFAEAKAAIEQLSSIAREGADVKVRINSLKKDLENYNEADLRARVNSSFVEAYENGLEDEIERQKRFCSEALRSMNDKALEAEKELIRLENETENPARLAAELEETKKKYDDTSFKHDAVKLAESALTEASDNIRSSVSPLLRVSAERYMSSITGGKYQSMGIDGNYSMTADTRQIELLSAGTKDSAYIALRLALLEVIFRSEKPFLAVDEALARLDDGRAAAALKILSSYCDEGGQCILFTCHSREEKLLDGIAEAEIIRL